ncbi:MAG: HAMP domain-containing protein [Gammaproteobacteria bacterium]|nr:HAMP domain-containing protein [Gammaproteobacteria bacterium]
MIGHSLRWRLTAWYTLSLTLIVLLFASAIFIYVRYSLLFHVENLLRMNTDRIERVLAQNPKNLNQLDTQDGTELFQISDGEKIIYSTNGWQTSQLRFEVPTIPASGFGTGIAADGRRFYMRTVVVQAPNNKWIIAAAHHAAQIDQTLKSLATVLLIGCPIAITLALIGGYFLAGRMLAPIGSMAAKAKEISAHNLSQRLPVIQPNDELGRLATIFNDTLQRLEDAFTQLRRFTADASHELRTPLTVLRNVGENAINGVKDPQEYSEIIGSMLEEVERLTQLVEKLLLLTRADGDQTALNIERFLLAELAREVADCLQVLAEEKQQLISFQLQETISVRADRATLRLVLMNLLDNAIKYSPAHSAILINVYQTQTQAIVSIHDQGPGIAPEHQQKIFERFYRPDAGRARNKGGAGLGLAIAHWAAQINQAKIELESAPGTGSTFLLILPIA